MPVLASRIELHDHLQQEGQSAQDYLTQLSALSDVAKATDGAQGVGTDVESFVLIEEMLQSQHGKPPIRDLEGMEGVEMCA